MPLRIAFILGFALPYLYLAVNSPYLGLVYLMSQTALGLGLDAIPAVLGFIALALLAGRPLARSWPRYAGLYTTILVCVPVVPSLLMLSDILLNLGSADLFAAAFYTGLAVTAVLVPVFVLSNQIEVVGGLKGAVATPAAGTFLAYATLSLLSDTAPPGSASSGLTVVGSNLILMIPSIVSSLPQDYASAPATAGMVWPAVGVTFVMTCAFYFYYGPNSLRDVTSPRNWRSSRASLASATGTVLAAVSLNLLFLLLGTVFVTEFAQFFDLALLGSLVLVLLTIRRS